MWHYALRVFVAILLSACDGGDAGGPCGAEPDSQCVSVCANGECGELHTWDCNASTGEWRPVEEINECDWSGVDGGCASTAAGCNPVSQTGCCPEDKCGLVLEDGFGRIDCAPNGTRGIGEPCTEPTTGDGYDDCAAGGHCFDGRCREICTTINDTCSDGVCLEFADSAGNPQPLNWCMHSCDPLAQDCSLPGEACYAVGLRGNACMPSGGLAIGEPCAGVNDCAARSQCVESDDESTCRRLCGTIAQTWSTDKAGDLTWPLCCCADCTSATRACPESDQVCWAISDGAGGTFDTGFCQTDVEASNPDQPDFPWTCDCTSPPGPMGEVCQFQSG
jgi:hypothetical protein